MKNKNQLVMDRINAIRLPECYHDVIDSTSAHCFAEVFGDCYTGQDVIDLLYDGLTDIRYFEVDLVVFDSYCQAIDSYRGHVGYTGENYYNDCVDNADQEWIDMLSEPDTWVELVMLTDYNAILTAAVAVGDKVW